MSIRYCGGGADATALHKEKKTKMPDVVVVTIPKKDEPSEGLLPASLPPPPEALKPPPPPPKSVLAKLRCLLFLPIRTVRAFLSRLLLRLRKRLFGPQPKP